MTCVPAPACEAALTQATALWPTRNRATDGICAGPNHHPVDPNFDEHAVGEAFDLTHDPMAGCDTYRLAEQLRERNDPRVKYVISNRQIWNPTVEPWHWRPYGGPDPHTSHVHVSILHNARDDVSRWWYPYGGEDEMVLGCFVPWDVPDDPTLAPMLKVEQPVPGSLVVTSYDGAKMDPPFDPHTRPGDAVVAGKFQRTYGDIVGAPITVQVISDVHGSYVAVGTSAGAVYRIARKP